jgi:SAM-dependent methyltransferase
MSSSFASAPDDLLAEWAGAAPPGWALDLGAGSGETAAWLGQKGFAVDTVESDPEAFGRLAAATIGNPGRAFLADIRRHPLPRQRYSLVTALAFLHFFHPDDLGLLSRRISRALAPGGILIASVFTTDDPGMAARLGAGEPMLAPATFRFSTHEGVIHFFGPGELAGLFRDLKLLDYEESRRLDVDGGLRAGASIVARKPG